MWVPSIKFRSPGLASSPLPHWAILLAPNIINFVVIVYGVCRGICHGAHVGVSSLLWGSQGPTFGCKLLYPLSHITVATFFILPVITLFTFDPPGGDHDEPAVVVVVVCVMDAHSDLSDPDHLLHSHKDEFYGQKADALVEEVQGTEENQVPWGQRAWGQRERRAHW